MSQPITIYSGKIKHNSLSQPAEINFTLNPKTHNSIYTVIFPNNEVYNLHLNPNTETWEQDKLGETPLSKKCGQLIQNYFY